MFQQTIRDFSNDSAWRLTHRKRSARLRLPKFTPELPDPASLSPENRVAQTLYLNSENPALRKLSLRSAEFRQALGTAAEWGSVSRAAAEWVRALIAYDRSPLNLNDPELEKLRRQSRALTRMSHR